MIPFSGYELLGLAGILALLIAIFPDMFETKLFFSQERRKEHKRA